MKAEDSNKIQPLMNSRLEKYVVVKWKASHIRLRFHQSELSPSLDKREFSLTKEINWERTHDQETSR